MQRPLYTRYIRQDRSRLCVHVLAVASSGYRREREYRNSRNVSRIYIPSFFRKNIYIHDKVAEKISAISLCIYTSGAEQLTRVENLGSRRCGCCCCFCWSIAVFVVARDIELLQTFSRESDNFTGLHTRGCSRAPVQREN